MERISHSNGFTSPLSVNAPSSPSAAKSLQTRTKTISGTLQSNLRRSLYSEFAEHSSKKQVRVTATCEVVPPASSGASLSLHGFTAHNAERLAEFDMKEACNLFPEKTLRLSLSYRRHWRPNLPAS